MNDEKQPKSDRLRTAWFVMLKRPNGIPLLMTRQPPYPTDEIPTVWEPALFATKALAEDVARKTALGIVHGFVVYEWSPR